MWVLASSLSCLIYDFFFLNDSLIYDFERVFDAFSTVLVFNPKVFWKTLYIFLIINWGKKRVKKIKLLFHVDISLFK
jgi:hypothetical protein